MPEELFNTINEEVAWTNETALLLACRYGHQDIVEHLLGVPGISINIKDKRGFTGLGTAIESKHFDIARRLLTEDTIDISGRHLCNGSHNCTVLLHAIEQGSEATLKLFIRKGADFSGADTNGWTALHGAAKKGHQSTVEYL
ncbi:ankyrin, partial [Pluteus cervinus]